MTKFIQARTGEARGVLQVARELYGEAFGSADRRSLEDAAHEWSELSEGERSFATAHLLYLSVEAQAATQSLLEDVREAIEELEVTLEATLDDDAAPAAREPELVVDVVIDEADDPTPEGDDATT